MKTRWANLLLSHAVDAWKGTLPGTRPLPRDYGGRSGGTRHSCSLNTNHTATITGRFLKVLGSGSRPQALEVECYPGNLLTGFNILEAMNPTQTLRVGLIDAFTERAL